MGPPVSPHRGPSQVPRLLPRVPHTRGSQVMLACALGSAVPIHIVHSSLLSHAQKPWARARLTFGVALGPTEALRQQSPGRGCAPVGASGRWALGLKCPLPPSKNISVHGSLKTSRRKNACILWRALSCPMPGECCALWASPLPVLWSL